MEENQPKTSLYSHALKWGSILGAVSIVLTILLYVIDFTLMVNWKTGLISLAVFIGLTIYAGINYRSEIGGFMPFGKAFLHGFLVFAVSGLISTIFNLILYHVIDTELPAKLTEATLEKTAEIMQAFGAPEDKIDEAMTQARERTDSQYTVYGLFKGYFFILIFSAVFSLITGLIVRKNQPEEV